MIKDNVKMRIASDNKHLLDIFSDYHYIELGNIHYKMWTRLLKYHTLRINDIANFDIQNIGIGASKVTDKTLQNYLPYVNLSNIYKKNQTMQLFLTYGLVKLINENKKEIFAPLILVPVNLFIENNNLLIKVISKPLENNVLIRYLKKQKKEIPVEKLESIFNFDKYCYHFQKLGLDIRLENYLTVAKTIEPPIIIKHERFSLENQYEPLGNRYYRDDEKMIYNITLLNYRQRMAVQKASYGNSFAIKGSLGTGKTTTLINIATDAINRGKRILYVSNMKETLDCVEECFDEKGLKFLVNNLTNTSKFIIPKNKVDIPDYVVENPKEKKKELIKVYQDIDKYEKFLGGRIRNFRFLDVLKELLYLETYEVDAEIDDLDEIYKFEYEEVITSLYRIEDAMKKLHFKESKFVNIPINNNISYPNQVITLIYQIHKHFVNLKKSKDILEADFKFKSIPNYAKFKSIIANINNLKIDKLPKVWKKKSLETYFEARNKFPELKTLIYSLREYQLYLDWDYTNLESINVDEAISNLCGAYFTEVDIDGINNVIENHHELIGKARVGNLNFKQILKSIVQIKSILGWDFDNFDDGAIKEIIRLIDYLNTGMYHPKWFIKSQHNKTRNDLVRIQERLNHFIYLEKQHAKYFNNPNEIDINIEYLDKLIKSQKIVKKFKNVDLKKLLQELNEYRSLRTSAKKLNKLHIDLTGFEYSPAFNTVAEFDIFVDYLNNFASFNYETSITKFLLKVSERELESYAIIFAQFKKHYQIINFNFVHISTIINVDSSLGLLDKGEFLNAAYKYFTIVRDTNKVMQSIVKDGSKFIYFETYLKLKDRLNKLQEVKNLINESQEYPLLFGNLFETEKTNVNEISNQIINFDSYIDCFVDNKAVVASLNKNVEMNVVLDEATADIHEINDEFKLYSKIFKDGIGGYYYDSFEEIISHLEELLNAKDDLIGYLEITRNLKIINKYKLYSLSNYIINSDVSNIVNIFKDKYFRNLYNLYMHNNPNYFTNNEVNELLAKAVSLEKVLTESHIISLQALKANMGTNKSLYLSTTPILNYFLDYRKFDLILIDDAQLLDANEYYNAVNGRQVIIAGEDITQTTLTSNLISRMRDNYTMTFDFRYSPTPLHLLTLVPNLKGTFRSRVSETYGVEIISRDVCKYIAKLFIANPNLLVNYFTPKLETKFYINDVISQILIDNNFDSPTIFSILRSRLNIVDLFDNYVYDADYNILDLQDYYLYDTDLVSLNGLSSLLACKKQLVIIDNDNILRKEINSKFMNAIAPIFKQNPMFNVETQDVLLKLASELNKHEIIVHGTLFDLGLVLERNNTYYGVLLFANPDNTHINLLEDYRDYYEVYKKNNMKVLIIDILDLVKDFNSVIKYLQQETLT